MTIYRHTASGPGTAGDIWTVTMHSSSSASLTAAHSAWQTAVTGFWDSASAGAYWSTLTQVTDLETDQLDPTTGRNVAQARSAVTLKGTDTGQVLPPRVAMVTGLRTALPTRSGRGRMYWPAPTDSFLTTSGLLLSTTATAVAGFWATELGNMATTSPPVILHRASMDTTPITSVTVGVVLDTQRRRTNKVAPSYASASL